MRIFLIVRQNIFIIFAGILKDLFSNLTEFKVLTDETLHLMQEKADLLFPPKEVKQKTDKKIQ